MKDNKKYKASKNISQNGTFKNDTPEINELSHTRHRKYIRRISGVPVYEWTNEQRENTFAHIKMREVNCGPHFHSHMEIFILHTNEQEITINGQTMLLHAGDIGIADSLEVHSYKHHKDSLSDIFLIPSAFLNYFNDYKQSGHLSTNFIIDQPEIYNKFNDILCNIDSMSNPVLQRGAINTLLGIIIDTCKVTPQDSLDKDPNRIGEKEFARAVMEYISEHLTEDISQETAAKEFYYSAPYFSRKFKSVFGFTFMDYLNSARLSRFFELCETNPQANLTRLIVESGFNSLPSFYRHFVKKTGLTPSQFIEELQKK